MMMMEKAQNRSSLAAGENEPRTSTTSMHDAWKEGKMSIVSFDTSHPFEIVPSVCSSDGSRSRLDRACSRASL
jgi:hypothetical protein